MHPSSMMPAGREHDPPYLRHIHSWISSYSMVIKFQHNCDPTMTRARNQHPFLEIVFRRNFKKIFHSPFNPPNNAHIIGSNGERSEIRQFSNRKFFSKFFSLRTFEQELMDYLLSCFHIGLKVAYCPNSNT